MSDKKKDIFAPYVEVDENLPKHGNKIVFRDEQSKAIKDAFDHLSSAGGGRESFQERIDGAEPIDGCSDFGIDEKSQTLSGLSVRCWRRCHRGRDMV